MWIVFFWLVRLKIESYLANLQYNSFCTRLSRLTYGSLIPSVGLPQFRHSQLNAPRSTSFASSRGGRRESQWTAGSTKCSMAHLVDCKMELYDRIDVPTELGYRLVTMLKEVVVPVNHCSRWNILTFEPRPLSKYRCMLEY